MLESREERSVSEAKAETLKLAVGSNTRWIVGIVSTFASVALSNFVSYAMFRNLTDYRMAEIEKRQENHEARIVSAEQFGHPDHERRIVKLEARADTNDASVNSMKFQLGQVIVILERIERKVDKDAK